MVNVKRPKMEVMYTYIEPKTPQEAEDAHRRLTSAYDILFAEVLKRGGERKVD